MSPVCRVSDATAVRGHEESGFHTLGKTVLFSDHLNLVPQVLPFLGPPQKGDGALIVSRETKPKPWPGITIRIPFPGAVRFPSGSGNGRWRGRR